MNEEYFEYTFVIVNQFYLCLGKRSCRFNEFQCNNGNCIKALDICDHKNDCGDNSDESRTHGILCGMLNYVIKR